MCGENLRLPRLVREELIRQPLLRCPEKEIDSSSLNRNSSDPVKADRPFGENLSLQIMGRLGVVAVGEVLWDIFPQSSRLGGAPLNFGVHARRLGHDV